MLNDIYLDQRHSPFNTMYLQRMLRVINNATAQYPRTMAVRVDLRLPDNHDECKAGLISRFIESLNAKIEARYRSKLKQGIRCYPCHLRYAWVREVGEKSKKSHYHMALFVNKDTFNGLGTYSEEGTGLASLIQAAWLSALQLSPPPGYRTLVHIPDNPLYYLDVNALNYKTVYDKLTFRLSYFAKERTKSYNRNERSFGCSQS
ncbi:TPA: inovirus Gp2 family protein [Citrobacter koseri]|uniref:inovirus Gp2 family protein n=1 Tax=Citrobacter TaxID=544 RepID=UPI0017EF2445|nr:MULTISPECIES: inovirus Gp2 family protein [Citrobacter]EFA7375319.1 inovirus Gp2 family protein [Escherichia coli]MBJ9352772.1 inovirus Gp2 family protein [Citrobacter koseri]MDE9611712.1 inovirus Gp2 family protein [Citrobacter portucalensis]HCR3979420.1 inovirus Gp2 family protein [Citrobacter koseri]HEM6715804.1 inovirus Gp2 family protein [Citrobacter koseri]